ncbi:MAG: lipocalin family protein [Saprospiraceae bacterium]
MKTVAKILSLSIIVLLTSCKKDEIPNFNQADAVGTWDLAAVSCNDGMSTTTVPGIPPVSATFTVSGKNYNSTVTFNADGTYSSQGSYTAVITTVTQGQTDTQEEDTGFFEGMGTWSLSGNTMTVTEGTKTSTTTVEELTSTKMVMAVKINETVSDPVLGFSTVVKGTYRFTLTK